MGTSFRSNLMNRSIEDNVMTTCAAIVENCVIVGHLKPKVVLIIEPKNLDIDAAAFKTDILSRVSQRLFAYERISGPSQIIIAEKGSLPRTVVSWLFLVSLFLMTLTIRRRAMLGEC